MSWTRRPVWFALAAVLCGAAWQALTVHYNYGDNWTALFHAGANYFALPTALRSEHIYRFPDSYGYDGQNYHYMAHDPFLRRGFQPSIDAPRFRYRRILVPMSAWLLAGGQDRWIDRSYVVVIWVCVFLGALWTGLIALERGGHRAWSLAFLLLPAVLVSVDRLTVDVALAALTAGVVYYIDRRKWFSTAALCALACLVRESGLLIPLALTAWCAIERRWQRAAGVAMSIVPAVAWYLYIGLHTAPAGPDDLVSAIPFAGIVSRLGHPVAYRFGFAMNALVTILDYAAVAGMVAAIVYCAANWRRLARQADGAIAFLFVALIAVVSSPAVWEHAYAFARGYSPLLLIVALDEFRSRSRLAVLPVAMIAPRIALEMAPQFLGIVRGITGL
jgi:hypothetical protein